MVNLNKHREGGPQLSSRRHAVGDMLIYRTLCFELTLFRNVLPDSLYPEYPYPGARPPRSYVHYDQHSWLLDPAPLTPSGWTVTETQEDLEVFIERIAQSDHRPFIPLARRVPIMAYGSNINPSKLTWQRNNLQMPSDPIIVLYVSTRDLASVWSAGFRMRDGERPATITSIASVEERYAIWLATDEQVAVLDVTEARPNLYILARLKGPSGRVILDGPDGMGTGMSVDDILVYVGKSDARRPLLVGGKPVMTRDVPQAEARNLEGVVQSVDNDPLQHEVIEGEVEDNDRWAFKLENASSSI
jgi:hypothetical protein